MRDKRKNEAYFDSYISYEKERIDKKLEKLRSCDDPQKAGRINGTLLLYRLNLLIASFSRGEGREKLAKLHEEACSAAARAENLGYSDALTLASMAVMLDGAVAMEPVIGKYGELFSTDKLLRGLRSYLEIGKAVWEGEYRFPEIYGGLDEVLTAGSREAGTDCLLAYLDGWYDKCEDCSWYDTLENSNDVYYGYWCFEGAAVAAVCGLDVKRLAENEYFPVL